VAAEAGEHGGAHDGQDAKATHSLLSLIYMSVDHKLSILVAINNAQRDKTRKRIGRADRRC